MRILVVEDDIEAQRYLVEFVIEYVFFVV